jgi:hypothetical protein
MRIVMIRGHGLIEASASCSRRYFLAGGTLGASLGRNNGDGERRREDTGSIWTITRLGGKDALHKNSS